MNFIEIRNKFENKNYSIRSDFINEYHFKDTHIEYYRKFITDNILQIKNVHYLTDIIDLCGFLNFFDNKLYNVIVGFLYKNNFLVKLSVLNYLKRIDRYYNEAKKSEALLLKFQTYNFKHSFHGKYFLEIICYQLLLQLSVSSGDIKKSKKYFEIYIGLLKKNKNSAIAWRAYNDALDEPYLRGYKEQIITIVKKQNEKEGYRHKMG